MKAKALKKWQLENKMIDENPTELEKDYITNDTLYVHMHHFIMTSKLNYIQPVYYWKKAKDICYELCGTPRPEVHISSICDEFEQKLSSGKFPFDSCELYINRAHLYDVMQLTMACVYAIVQMSNLKKKEYLTYAVCSYTKSEYVQKIEEILKTCKAISTKTYFPDLSIINGDVKSAVAEDVYIGKPRLSLEGTFQLFKKLKSRRFGEGSRKGLALMLSAIRGLDFDYVYGLIKAKDDDSDYILSSDNKEDEIELINAIGLEYNVKRDFKPKENK